MYRGRLGLMRQYAGMGDAERIQQPTVPTCARDDWFVGGIDLPTQFVLIRYALADGRSRQGVGAIAVQSKDMHCFLMAST